MSGSGDQVWRVDRVSRTGALVACLLVTAAAVVVSVALSSALVVTLGWVLVVAMIAWTWRWFLVPYLAVTPTSLVVQNPLARHELALTEIDSVRPAYSGLDVRLADGQRVSAWAVQNADLNRMTHKRKRAERVCAVIRTRLGEMPQNPRTFSTTTRTGTP